MGDDILTSGPDEPPRVPRFVVVIGAVLALLAALQVVRQLTSDHDEQAQSQARQKESATLVQEPAPLAERTGLSVLTGGDRITRVDVDTGRTTVLYGAGPPDGPVVALLNRPAGQVALARGTLDEAWLLRPGGASVLLGPACAIAPVDSDKVALVTRTGGALTVRTLALSPVPRQVAAVRLPSGTRVVAGTAGRLLAEVTDHGLPALVFLDARTGIQVGSLAVPGHALAADGRRVAWLRAGCREECLVRMTDLRVIRDDVVAVLAEERVGSAALAPDGRVAMTAVVTNMGQKQTAVVVGGTAPFVIRTAQLNGLAPSMTWSPDGAWVFLVDRNGGLLAWSRATGVLSRAARTSRVAGPAPIAVER